MERECGRIRQAMADAGGRRAAYPPGVAEHLAACLDCRDLAALLEAMAGPEGSPTADYRAADLALERARAIRAGREETRRFAVFVAVACAFLALLVLAGAGGRGLWVVGFQGASVAVLPFLGLFALRRRAQGDAQWT